jgi:DNA-binding NarL/FixJ family response regulator
MSRLRILIADDHEGFRHSLVSFLRAQANVEVVGEAVDDKTAIEQAQRLHPDLTLLDLDMPGRSGLETTQEMKRRLPETKVVVLSMHPAEIYRTKAKEAHADGYIEKSSMKQGLVEVLRESLKSKESFSYIAA